MNGSLHTNAPLSLSIVLPCLNEEANIQRVVGAAVAVGRKVAHDLEVIVVNDGSRDQTGKIADSLARELPEVRVLHNARRLGYGGALKRGFRAARKDWVFYTDADGQFDVRQLVSVLPLLESHDVVSCYRIERRDSWLRVLSGRVWSALMNVLFGLRLRDVNCAFKIYPRSLIESLDMTSTGALIDAEMLAFARVRGLRIAQTGVLHAPRVAGRSTGGHPAVVTRALAELAHLIVRFHIGPRKAALPGANGSS